VERRPERVPRSVGTTEAPLVHDGVRTREELTWIAIRLAYDDDPSVGVGYARYELTLPDGTVKTGRLDRDGNARVDQIPPGTCEVVFPDYDKRKGSPPAKVPPGKGHTPRRRKTEAPPTTLPPAPTSRTETPCEKVRWEVLNSKAKTRKIEGNRVQVVAIPSYKVNLPFELPLQVDGWNDLGKSTEKVLAAVRSVRQKGISQAAKDWEEDAPSPAAFTWKLKPVFAVTGGDEARTEVRLTSPSGCAASHRIVTSSGDARELEPNHWQLRLPRSDRGWHGSSARPVVIQASGTGCSGAPAPLSFELFPGDTTLLAGEVSAELDLKTTPAAQRIRSFFRRLLGVDVTGSVSFAARLEHASMWKEDDDLWRAYWTTELSFILEAKLALRVEFSLLALALKIPEEFRSVAGDIAVFGALDVAPSFTAKNTSRVDDAGKPVDPPDAPPPFEFKIAVSVGIYGRVGSESVFGCMITGTGSVEGKVAGITGLDGGRLFVKGEYEIGPIKGEVSIMGRALIMAKAFSVTVAQSRPLLPTQDFDWTVFKIGG
jgi:hypothetical protein